MKFYEIIEKDFNKLDSFVQKHSKNNIFQTSYYYKIHIGCKNFQPFAFVVTDNNRMLGSVMGVIHSNYFPPVKNFTKRAIIIGGPIIENDDPVVLSFLLSSLNKSLDRKVVYTQFRNLWDFQNSNSIFLKNQYTYIPHLDIIHNLNLNAEEIKSNIDKNKRGNINKAINKGVKFYEVKDELAQDYGINLILSTYKRIGLPCPPFNYFKDSLHLLVPDNKLKMFASEYENKIIGCRLELCHNGLIYDWYAGYDENYKNRYPNDFLPYHIMVWGSRNGYQYFDFGGAGKPDVSYGVREHKLKFGGNLVEYGRYQKINKQFIMKIGELGITTYRDLTK